MLGMDDVELGEEGTSDKEALEPSPSRSASEWINSDMEAREEGTAGVVEAHTVKLRFLFPMEYGIS